MTAPRFKYLVLPGYVSSQNDGDRHFIGAAQLIRLYGVHPSECRILSWDDEAYETKIKQIEKENPNVIRLRPRYRGDYTLPSPQH